MSRRAASPPRAVDIRNIHVNSHSSGPELVYAARQLRRKAAVHAHTGHAAEAEKSRKLSAQIDSAAKYKMSHAVFRRHTCDRTGPQYEVAPNCLYPVNPLLYCSVIISSRQCEQEADARNQMRR